MISFMEIQKLHEMLTAEDIPHTYAPIWDGMQIRVYADAEMTNELDDCVYHSGSHGYHLGLLETYCLNDCEGFETAEQVFEGWKQMYQLTKGINQKTAECTLIGAAGEIWEGSMPSWD